MKAALQGFGWATGAIIALILACIILFCLCSLYLAVVDPTWFDRWVQS